jgi:uncharacterized protein (TIGR02757 family)
LVSACLAYGNVKQIFKSLENIFTLIGKNPYRFVKNFDTETGNKLFSSFVHRFTRGSDISLLFYYLKQIYIKYPSLEALFMGNYQNSDNTIEKGLTGFSSRILNLDCSPYYNSALPKNAGIRYLVSSPENKSACKRMNMFLRWMVRRNDGVDFGIWKNVDPSRLVLPLDTHTSRISRYIGLTNRKSADWKTALEITGNLKKLDPGDPVKYDFALSRLGILDKCEHRYKEDICILCELKNVCRLVV